MNKLHNQNAFLTFSKPKNASVSRFGHFYRSKRQFFSTLGKIPALSEPGTLFVRRSLPVKASVRGVYPRGDLD